MSLLPSCSISLHISHSSTVLLLFVTHTDDNRSLDGLRLILHSAITVVGRDGFNHDNAGRSGLQRHSCSSLQYVCHLLAC